MAWSITRSASLDKRSLRVEKIKKGNGKEDKGESRTR